MDDSFGKILREMRLEADIGLRELATLIGKSPGYLSDVELNQAPPPSEAMIIDIARAISVDKNLLLSAALKVDPEVSEYISKQPQAADFLRKAMDRGFEDEDWESLSGIMKHANLGKSEEDE